MLSSIIKIIIGVVLWKLVPGWIQYGNKKVRETIQLICNILGVVIVIFGVVSLVRTIF